MTDEPRPEAPKPKPIDESTYGASASESGGDNDDEGPTIANPEGDTLSEAEEELREGEED
jgi:hypothetical protein